MQTANSTRVLSELDKSKYDEFGYLSIDSFLSQEWLSLLKATAQEFVELSRTVTRSGKVFDIEPNHTPDEPRIRRLNSPVDNHSVFEEFALAGPAAQLAIELLGSPVRFHHSKLNFKWADGGEEVKWHQDIQFWPHTDFTPLTIGIYLDDVSHEMGPMGVFPGSHNGPLHDLYAPDGSWAGAINDQVLKTLDMNEVKWLQGPAGSATVHNCCLIHGSMPNVGRRTRPLLLQTYSAEDSYPISGIGANGVTGAKSGTIIGGIPHQRLEIEERSMHGAPDWSRQGAPTIFGSQQKERI